jgi:hypothetical protein
MTRWIFHPAIGAEQERLRDWAGEYLSPYDLSSLDQVRIDVGDAKPGADTWQGVHGYCDYPQGRGKRRRGFRIYGEVAGPYPFTLHAGGTRIRNLNEAVAWILGHELFHFLCESGQVRGRNSEPEAVSAGKAAVKHYRAFAARRR